MSLQVAKGSFAFPASTTPGTYSVTGLPFQPKAVIFWVTSQTATGFAVNRRMCIGFTAGATQNASLSLASDDAQTVATTIGNRISTSLCIRTINVSGSSVSTDADAQLSSFNSDGFTLSIVNAVTGNQYIVHYLALGGTDLTNAFVGAYDAPTTATSQAYTGVGFKPDCMLFLANTTGTGSRDDVGWKMSLGAADGTSQAVASVCEQDALPTNLQSVQVADSVIYTRNFGGTDNTRASLTSFDSDGFTLNFSVAQGTARNFLVLALKGGKYKITTDTQKTSVGTQAKSGLGFHPSGLMLWGTDRAASTAVDTSLASLSIGASDGTNEGSSWNGSTDNVSTTDENQATSTSKALQHATNASTINAEADVASFDSDGYTLNWTTADATAREFLSLVFGSVAIPYVIGYSTVDASAGDGSISVTVPSSATGAVAFWGDWDGNALETLATLTLDGSAFTIDKQLAEGAITDANGTGVATLYTLTGTGSRTLAWTWSAGGARTEGGQLMVVWIANGVATRDAQASHSTGPQNNYGPVTVNTETNDLVLACLVNFSSPYVLGGISIINDQLLNSESYDVSQFDVAGATTGVTATSSNYPALVVVSISPTNIAPVVTNEAKYRHNVTPMGWR